MPGALVDADILSALMRRRPLAVTRAQADSPYKRAHDKFGRYSLATPNLEVTEEIHRSRR